MAPLCGRGKSGRAVTVVLSLLLFLIPITLSAGRSGISHWKLEVRKQLKRLNKPALKSIKSPDGDIIDCVHLKNQPAFDHPLLKNHKIQMAPSSYPEGRSLDESKASSNSEPIAQLWHLNGGCPEGTIPMRRTKEEDLLRTSSIESYGRRKTLSVPRPSSAKPEAIPQSNNKQNASVYLEGQKYYGAQAGMSLWQPQVEHDEYSSSQIWILGGAGKDLNSIEAGWHVNPHLYGDNRSRLFGYWTADGYQSTGCHNLLCSGFVQVNPRIALGSTTSPVSTYGGSQFQITIQVWKDVMGGNWWMEFGQKQLIGYWPAALFSHLNDSASRIQWGGEVLNLESGGQHTTTKMGSGHFPGEGFGKASFFRNILFVNGNNTLKDPNAIGAYSTQLSCYDVQNGNNREWGHYFYYGGPGRNPNCP